MLRAAVDFIGLEDTSITEVHNIHNFDFTFHSKYAEIILLHRSDCSANRISLEGFINLSQCVKKSFETFNNSTTIEDWVWIKILLIRFASILFIFISQLPDYASSQTCPCLWREIYHFEVTNYPIRVYSIVLKGMFCIRDGKRDLFLLKFHSLWLYNSDTVRDVVNIPFVIPRDVLNGFCNIPSCVR